MQACTAQVPRHARQRRRRYTISGAHNLKPPTVCSDPTPHLPGWHWRAAPSARRRPSPPPPASTAAAGARGTLHRVALPQPPWEARGEGHGPCKTRGRVQPPRPRPRPPLARTRHELWTRGCTHTTGGAHPGASCRGLAAPRSGSLARAGGPRTGCTQPLCAPPPGVSNSILEAASVIPTAVHPPHHIVRCQSACTPYHTHNRVEHLCFIHGRGKHAWHPHGSSAWERGRGMTLLWGRTTGSGWVVHTPPHRAGHPPGAPLTGARTARPRTASSRTKAHHAAIFPTPKIVFCTCCAHAASDKSEHACPAILRRFLLNSRVLH
jgi:hypothetical protein